MEPCLGIVKEKNILLNRKLFVTLVKNIKADFIQGRVLRWGFVVGVLTLYTARRRDLIAKEQGGVSGWKVAKRKHQGLGGWREEGSG